MLIFIIDGLKTYNRYLISINLLILQILTVQICKARRLLYIMKATGIVRRIEEYGIIGQKSKKPHKH